MIEIYLMKTKEFYNEKRFAQACALVDSVRLQKIEACKSTEDKVRSLCCGLLLQHAVKKKYPLSEKCPIELTYCYKECGKPYLTDYPQLHFNLSHSGDYAALALSEQEVGMDIQKRRSLKETMVKKVLSKQEYTEYEKLSEAEREEFFFRCWCAKESYSKWNGKGLLQDFSEIIYEPQKEQISGKDVTLRCREYSVGTEYFLNACVCEAEEFAKEVTYLTFSHILS